MNGGAFERNQARTARRLGYGEDVEAMNRDHDPLHRALCEWLGLPSYSLSASAGHPVDPDLARYEEAAVLAVQRFLQMAGGTFPGRIEE